MHVFLEIGTYEIQDLVEIRFGHSRLSGLKLVIAGRAKRLRKLRILLAEFPRFFYRSQKEFYGTCVVADVPRFCCGSQMFIPLDFAGICGRRRSGGADEQQYNAERSLQITIQQLHRRSSTSPKI